MNKIFAVAGVVIKELYRRKDFYVLFVLTAVVTLATGAVNFFHDDKIVRFVKDACMLLIWVSTLIIAIVTTARQIPAERESRTIFPLLAKPVSRAQVIVGKFLGCWFATGLALLVFYTFFVIISGSREQSWPMAVYFEGAWMQWFMLGIVIAMVLWGSIHLAAPSSTITIVFIIVIGILFVGKHLKTVALSQPEPRQTFLTILYYFIPHLEWYDLRDFVVYDQNPAPALAVVGATVYAIVWSAIFLSIGLHGLSPQSTHDLMNNWKASPGYLLAALISVAFTMALSLEGQLSSLTMSGKSDNLFGMLLGDGRKLFANQFFTMADVYFHSGYYPSVFDANAEQEKDIVSASHDKKESEEEEKGEDFLGKPKDWIDAFGRNFKVVHHTHLENGNEREMLPWLRLAADLDPQKVDTYTVGAYFLWEHLGRRDQAEAFLREGFRNNPDSCEILFEMGRLDWQGDHDANRARNVWQLGIKKFLERSPDEEKETRLVYEEIVVNLAEMEAQTGNYEQAINWFHAAQQVSPNPAALQKQIDAIQQKMSAPH